MSTDDITRSLQQYNIESPTDEQMLEVIYAFIQQKNDPQLNEFGQQIHEESRRIYDLNQHAMIVDSLSNKANMLACSWLILARNEPLNTPANKIKLNDHLNNPRFDSELRLLYQLEKEALLEQRQLDQRAFDAVTGTQPMHSVLNAL